MATNTYQIIEEKNRKKSKKITIAVHVALLALLLFPFLNQETPEPAPQAVLVMNFDDEFKSASAKSSTKKAATTNKTEKKPVKKPVTKKKPVKKPTPKPTATKKPVIKTDKPERKIETKPNVADKKVDVPMKDPVPNVPEVPEEVVEEEAEETPTAEAGGAPDTAGSTSGNGEGKSGSSDSGDSKTDGVADKGNNGMDFSGEGIFNRKVIYRADVKKVTTEEGKIVINLCINQEGRVVYGKLNDDLTTIETSSVQRKAIQIATDYRFERDYTAPKKQCGKLTFIFEIEEE